MWRYAARESPQSLVLMEGRRSALSRHLHFQNTTCHSCIQLLQEKVFFRELEQHPAISGDLLSAVISTRYILGFRKDNPNVFNMLVQNLPHSSGIKCICY